jgi:hypothetical protein
MEIIGAILLAGTLGTVLYGVLLLVSRRRG